MNYQFSARNAQQGIGNGPTDLEVAEGDFQFIHFASTGANWESKYELNISPQCLYRKLYINAYNDASTNGSYLHGRLTFKYNRRDVFSTLFTFVNQGTAPIITGLPTIGAMMPGMQTGLGTSTDGLVITRPVTAGYIFISPIALYLTADTVVFEKIQEVATASRGVMFMAVKSMKGPY